MLKHHQLLYTLCFCSLCFFACKKDDSIRHYQEREIVATPKKMPGNQRDPHAGLSGDAAMGRFSEQGAAQNVDLAWKVPTGWKEFKTTGMRLATFIIPVGNNDSVECSLIRLQGEAGGLSNNVKRWLQQLKITIPGDAAFKTYLANQKRFKTKGNFEGVFVDFTTLLTGNLTANNSGMISVISTGSHTIFIKLFGPQKVLQQNKAKFLSLSSSLEVPKK
ncbi:MAG: hypothetical protein HQK83_14645 [Fibrobacteria bacterium]|nr:hypothetical protein [Fibrobacteria bacterium]